MDEKLRFGEKKKLEMKNSIIQIKTQGKYHE
jgi:hypothetical protein